MRSILWSLAIFAVLGLMVTSASADVVFYEDFNEDADTALHDLAPEVGGTWNQTVGIEAGAMINGTGEADFNSGGAQVYGAFTDTLGAGETLELRFDTNTPTNSMFGGNWCGISLYEGGAEKILFGDGGWSTNAGWDLGAFYNRELKSGGEYITEPDQDDFLFTYEYDTGAFQISFDGGNTFVLEGTGTAGLALSQLRIARGSSGIAVDSIEVKITAVPEPGTIALLITGLLGLGVVIARRKK